MVPWASTNTVYAYNQVQKVKKVAWDVAILIDNIGSIVMNYFIL